MSAWAVVVGTVGGALVGGGIALVTQHLRFRHDDRTRWLDLRRELAVRFLDATDEIFKWTQNLAALAQKSGHELQFEGVANPVDAMHKLAEADEKTRKLNTEIDLVGTKAERSAAMRLRNAVWANDGEQPAGEVFAARTEFQEAVRNALVPRPQVRRLLWRRGRG